MVSFQIKSLAETQRLANALAKVAAPGLTVLLDGPVGAGKTTLARATLQQLMRLNTGHVEDVPSPTFTLVQTYDVGAFEAWHADLYRLSSPDELIELGFDQAFELGFCLIEWPDRLGDMVPDRSLTLKLMPDPDSTEGRHVSITGNDARLAQWVSAFERQAA